MERWSVIPGWEFYEISDHGRIRSWKPYHNQSIGRREVPIIKKSQRNPEGYRFVALREFKNKKIVKFKSFMINRLVAMAFVEGDHSLQAAHLDGNKENNHYSNLKWCSPKENTSHKFAHGTMLSGERHPSTALCDRGVNAILRMVGSGVPYSEIAFFFDIGVGTISSYVNATSRKALTLGRGA